jgi:hypothetical protein
MAKKKTRIKIKDLPRDMKVSREEMKKVLGGAYTLPTFTTLSPFPKGTVFQSGGGCGCGCG